MFIDGQWETGSGARIDVLNPARGEPIGTIPLATAQEIDRAVHAARAAFPSWSQLTPAARAKYLKHAAILIRERSEDLGRLMTREQGKPVNEAIGEIDKLANAFDYYAEEALRVHGEIVANESSDFLSLIVREPVGVVAAITPWNYPAELIGWKVAAGLAAGCTLVVKPPELTPLCPLAIMECLAKAELPKGTVNMVTGEGRSAGQQLVESREIDKIAFTGSSMTGLHIQQSAKTVKRMSLELGGNCPMIVADSADLDEAVKGAVRRSFRNSGQICVAINRIYVARKHYEVFLAKMASAAEKLIVDDGLTNPAADLGALCSQDILDKTKAHLADALAKGARLITGGTAPSDKKLARGYFFRPTLIADCTAQMDVMRAETFGPLAGIAPYDTPIEAVQLANDTDYGLASYLYSKDMDEIRYFTRNLDYGNVTVNNVDAGIINAPFSGRKQSGVGVEHGREGLLEYLNYKHIRLCFDEGRIMDPGQF